jgi:hypothetical protein
MHPADRSLVRPVPPKNPALKRGILFTFLTIFSGTCFWFALSGVKPPPCPLSPLSSAGTAQDTTTCGPGSAGQARPSSSSGAMPMQGGSQLTPSAGNSHVAIGPSPLGAGGRGGGSGGSTGGGSASAAISTVASNGRGSDTSSNPLTCRSQCQTSNSTCQATCSRGHNVTTDTQGWLSCVQSCNSKAGICANACFSGIKPPTNPELPAASATAGQAATPSRSAATPPLAIQMPDSSSSSSSSGQ